MELEEWRRLVAQEVERSRRVHKPRDEEHRIQVACVGWFRAMYPELGGLLFAVPNGGRRDKVTASKLKSEGVVAGVADLVLLVPRGRWASLLVEMKTERGRLSESQKEWSRLAVKAGNRYQVCRSLGEFQEVIKEYLKK